MYMAVTVYEEGEEEEEEEEEGNISAKEEERLITLHSEYRSNHSLILPLSCLVLLCIYF